MIGRRAPVARGRAPQEDPEQCFAIGGTAAAGVRWESGPASAFGSRFSVTDAWDANPNDKDLIKLRLTFPDDASRRLTQREFEREIVGLPGSRASGQAWASSTDGSGRTIRPL